MKSGMKSSSDNDYFQHLNHSHDGHHPERNFRCFIPLESEAMIALIVLLSFLFVSTFTPLMTLISLLILMPLFLLTSNTILPSLRSSDFFLSWTITSFLIITSVFEFQVVPSLEVQLYENFLFILMAAVSLTCSILIRRRGNRTLYSSIPLDNNHEHNTQSGEVAYCCWLKTNINRDNRTIFMWGLVVTITGLVYGSQVMMTTICHPHLMYENLLVPDDCSDVYSDLS